MITDPRVEKLPQWARKIIRDLENYNLPAINEIAGLRVKVDKLRSMNRKLHSRIAAMVEMFQCAAKGENEVAKAVQSIIEDWVVSDHE